MLFTGYLEKGEDDLSGIYVNNIVRNVDIRTIIPNTSVTGKNFVENFEAFKRKLWEKHKIDISK